MRNVLDELPREQHAQTLNVMRAAWKLTDADQGVKKLEQLARFWSTITNRQRSGVQKKHRSFR